MKTSTLPTQFSSEETVEMNPAHQDIQSPESLQTASMILVATITIVSLSIAIYKWLPKLIKPSFSSKPQASFPCLRCHYFSPNPYIKCTLHPNSVLTDEAINCQDYSRFIEL